MWDEAQIDDLTEAVVQRLLVDGGAARVLAVEFAGKLSTEAPQLPALALALPFSLAAGGIEEMLGAGQQACAAAHDAWRVAAMIGAEVLALQAGSQAPVTVAQLHALWSDGDAVFSM